MPSPPRIGWVTLEEPAVSGGGGARRQHFLVQALSREFHVELLSPASVPDLKIGRMYRLRRRLNAGAAPPSTSAFDRVVSGRLQSGAWQAVVVAHVETGLLMRRCLRVAPCIVDFHNVYSRYSLATGRTYAAKRWRRSERLVARAAEHTIAISLEDADILRAWSKDVMVIENGIDPEEWGSSASDLRTGESSLAFFGDYRHQPNRDGVDWFIDEVWPRVIAAQPSAVLNLYGPNAPSNGWSAPNVVAHGRVEGLCEHLQRQNGVIVPIVRGVGSRVKFIEALASGRPVVSTRIGAEGYAGAAGLYLCADSPTEFAEACISTLRNDPAAVDVGKRARSYALGSHSWQRMAEPLIRAVQQLVARRDSPSDQRSAG